MELAESARDHVTRKVARHLILSSDLISIGQATTFLFSTKEGSLLIGGPHYIYKAKIMVSIIQYMAGNGATWGGMGGNWEKW